MSDSEQRVMFVFPGQGSQYPGMGSDLYRQYAAARRIYDEASEVLDYDMARLSFEDPDGELDLTRFTQPALLTHHMACLEVFRERVAAPINPVAAAGHSLGEYSALVVAGALSFAEGLRLVRHRGELMSEHGEGGMLALPLDVDAAQRLAEKHFCAVASLNLPQQTVVGGAGADLDGLAEEVSALYPRRPAVRLKTEGAFHTYFMVEAACRFRSVLDVSVMAVPRFPVLSNYSGGFHDPDVESIKARLFFQLFNPVDWMGCLRTAMGDAVSTVIEFGGGIGVGEGPGDKRPNLESIIKKAWRALDYSADYVPAINTVTIEAAMVDRA